MSITEREGLPLVQEDVATTEDKPEVQEPKELWSKTDPETAEIEDKRVSSAKIVETGEASTSQCEGAFLAGNVKVEKETAKTEYVTLEENVKVDDEAKAAQDKHVTYADVAKVKDVEDEGDDIVQDTEV
jgi:hypothetical protein